MEKSAYISPLTPDQLAPLMGPISPFKGPSLLSAHAGNYILLPRGFLRVLGRVFFKDFGPS